MMRFLCLLLFLSEPLAAHPHSKVEQQAMLSIGLDRAALTIRIVPSYDEGAEIYAHLDLNGDGMVSDTEATQFANAVLLETALSVDGVGAKLRLRHVSVPDAKLVLSGEGIIEVKADARYPKLEGQTHDLTLATTYEDLSHDWFIQPFFFKNILALYPALQIARSMHGRRVTVDFSRK